MKAFLGTFSPKLDDKNRLALPAKFRDRMVGGLVITKGQDRCLFVFPLEEFNVISDQLRQAPMTSKSARAYTRVFFASADDQDMDRQGRITVPARLRDYAGLSKDCVVIGSHNRLEIWDSASWDSYLDASDDTYSEQAEEVLPGVI